MSERTIKPLLGSARRREVDELIAQVAPVMPPCFSKRATWIDALRAIQADPLCPPEQRPLTASGGFNLGVNFCAGCTPDYRADQGHLCRPDWYRDEDDEEGL